MTGADTPLAGRLLVIEPSSDYGLRIRRHVPDALFLATGERAARLQVHGVLHVDCTDTETAALAVQQHAAFRSGAIDGITCFICERLEATARLAARLGLPFHDPAVVQRSRQKDLAMSSWEAAGVPTPPGRLVRNLQEALDFAATVPPPWILKPTDRSGSEWVLRVNSASGLPAAYARIQTGLSSPTVADPRPTAPCLIQACVTGREISADLFIDAGQVAAVLRWTEKALLSTPDQAGLVSAYYPATLFTAEQACLQRAWSGAIAALGVVRGIVMADAILADGEPYVLEVGLRPGGDCLPDLCRMSTGYDPVRAACQVALGLRPDGPRREPATVAAVHLMTAVSGRVVDLDWSAVAAHPAVVQIEPYCTPGDHLRVWPGSYDDRIIGACLVRYDTPHCLPDLVTTLSRLVDIKLDSPAVQAKVTEAA